MYRLRFQYAVEDRKRDWLYTILHMNDKNVKINVKALLEQKFYPLIKGLLQEKPYSITYSVLSATSMEQETQVFSDQTNLEILWVEVQPVHALSPNKKPNVKV